jgi:hypothetical protein
MADISSQIVYVLTNPAMTGLVKIGKTTQLEVEERMKQLYGTGVPVPFDCAFACQVKDASEVEKMLHFAFGMHRINPNREFFKIEPDRVIAVLKLLQVDDITAKFEKQLESESTAVDIQSSIKLKATRRSRMSFDELDIPLMSTLIFKDGSETIAVCTDRTVVYQGTEMSLTMATRKKLGLSDDYSLQPSPYWTFNGKSLKEIYEDVHNSFVEE